MNTRRLSRAAAWPTNSSSAFGRSAASRSSGRFTAEIMRSGSVTDTLLTRALLQRQPDQRIKRWLIAKLAFSRRDSETGIAWPATELHQRRYRVHAMAPPPLDRK